MRLPHKQRLQLKMREEQKQRLALQAETASQAAATIKTEAHLKRYLRLFHKLSEASLTMVQQGYSAIGHVL